MTKLINIAMYGIDNINPWSSLCKRECTLLRNPKRAWADRVYQLKVGILYQPWDYYLSARASTMN